MSDAMHAVYAKFNGLREATPNGTRQKERQSERERMGENGVGRLCVFFSTISAFFDTILIRADVTTSTIQLDIATTKEKNKKKRTRRTDKSFT